MHFLTLNPSLQKKASIEHKQHHKQITEFPKPQYHTHKYELPMWKMYVTSAG